MIYNVHNLFQQMKISVINLVVVLIENVLSSNGDEFIAAINEINLIFHPRFSSAGNFEMRAR